MTLIHRLSEDPLIDLKIWLDEASQQGLPEPNAMTLGTASKDAFPSARMVLCKAIEPDGIHFFTNYESRKSRDLLANPLATAVFFWPTLARQVRVEGRVEKVSRKISEDYFRTRPRGSQVGAWVSQQSTEIADYQTLETQFREREKAFSGQDVPCPPHWGGFVIVPSSVEFWLGLPSRLHDRVLVTRTTTGDKKVWQKKQLAP
jgi:pyridoxamine 5'-phosphate oxidase